MMIPYPLEHRSFDILLKHDYSYNMITTRYSLAYLHITQLLDRRPRQYYIITIVLDKLIDVQIAFVHTCSARVHNRSYVGSRNRSHWHQNPHSLRAALVFRFIYLNFAQPSKSKNVILRDIDSVLQLFDRWACLMQSTAYHLNPCRTRFLIGSLHAIKPACIAWPPQRSTQRDRRSSIF